MVSILAALTTDVLAVEIECVLVYFLCIADWRKKEGFSIYVIFLITMFVFCVSMVVGDLIDVDSIYYFEKFGESFRFNDDVVLKTLKSVIFFLAGIVIGWELYKKRKPSKRKNAVKFDNYAFSSTIKKPMFLLFFLLFIPALAKSILLVTSAMMFGYVESMHLGAVLEVNPIVYYTSAVFEIYGILCLYVCRSQKEFIMIASLYAIPTILTIFTGLRGPALITILFLLWVYNTYYKEVKLKYWVIGGVILALFAQMIGYYRGDDVELEQSVIQRLMSFIVNQGESYHTISMTILYEDSFTNKIPFFIGYIPDMFVDVENYSIDAIEQKNYLAFHLAYNAFNNAFMVGHTIGTSMIAEFYELVKGNYVFIIPCSALTMYIAAYLSDNLYKNPVVFAIGFKYLMCFLYSPRDSVGKIFTRGFLYLIIFMIIITLFYRLKKKKSNIIKIKNI